VSNLIHDWNRAPAHHDRTEDLEIEPDEVIAHEDRYAESEPGAEPEKR
jgi:hypothetical protein